MTKQPVPNRDHGAPLVVPGLDVEDLNMDLNSIHEAVMKQFGLEAKAAWKVVLTHRDLRAGNAKLAKFSDTERKAFNSLDKATIKLAS